MMVVLNRCYIRLPQLQHEQQCLTSFFFFPVSLSTWRVVWCTRCKFNCTNYLNDILNYIRDPPWYSFNSVLRKWNSVTRAPSSFSWKARWGQDHWRMTPFFSPLWSVLTKLLVNLFSFVEEFLLEHFHIRTFCIFIPFIGSISGV